MRRLACVVVLGVLAGGSLSCQPEILEQRIRAGYCGVATPVEHAQDLADHGFNAVWMKMNFEDQYLDEMAAWGGACDEAGIAWFVVGNMTGGAERALQGYRHAVDEQGATLEIACLRDPAFMDLVLRDRANAALDAAEREGYELAGFILDPETYGIRGSYHRLLCYCDTCWADFIREYEIEGAGDVAAGARMIWLTRNQRYLQYQAWMEREWEAVFAAVADDLRERKPDLLMGNFHYMDTPFHRALLRGLGTEAAPALVGWESPSYTGGLIDGEKQAEYYASIGAHAVDVGGQWIGKLLPEAAAIHAYQMALNTAGYWLFNSSTLMLNWQETEPTSPYHLPRPAEEYWAAYQRANEEIDRKLADPDHASPLDVDLGSKLAMPAVPSSPEAIAESLAQDAELVPLHPEATEPPELDGGAAFRRAGMMLAWLEAGERLRGRVETVWVGSYATNATWAVVSPDGTELASNMVAKDTVDEIDVEAPVTGVYTLFFQAGSNGVRAELDAPHQVLREYLNGTVWIVYEPPPLYFYVPPSADQFSLAVISPGGQEGCDARVYDPDGSLVLEEIDASGTFEFTPTPDQRGRPWRIELTKTPNLVFEDIEVHLEGCPPYYAYSPEALLVPPKD